MNGFAPFFFAMAAGALVASQSSAQTASSSDADASASVQTSTLSQSVVYGDTIYGDAGDGIADGIIRSEAEITNVPNVTAPGVITAHNCALGTSVGASIVGGGISFGGSYVDENCERISQAAAINTLAGKKAAIIHLAQSPEVCKSLRQAGVIAQSSICGDEPSQVPRNRDDLLRAQRLPSRRAKNALMVRLSLR